MDYTNNYKKFPKKKNLSNLKGICKNSHCHSCSKFLMTKQLICKVINTNYNNLEASSNENSKDYLCPNTLNDLLNNININE